MPVTPTPQDFLPVIDDTLTTYFEQSIQDAATIDPSYRQLWEVMHALIRSGGKRLRPRITILSYMAFGGEDWEKIIPVAAAQELLHFSLLIHDDIIDRDFTRYGTLNVSGRYKEAYSKFIPSSAEQTHFANSAAILGGDLMLAGSYQLISESSLTEQQKRSAHLLLSRSIFEVAGGELLDTESSFVPYTDGDALKIARYKTAGYSFMTPLVTGATLACADGTQIAMLKELATHLGAAYQLVDDLIGVFGHEQTTGKSTTSDILEGKRTFMVEQAISAMTIIEKDTFNTIFGNPSASAEDIEHVKQLLVSTGAKAVTEQKVREYAAESMAIVASLEITDEHRNKFIELVTKVTERSF